MVADDGQIGGRKLGSEVGSGGLFSVPAQVHGALTLIWEMHPQGSEVCSKGKGADEEGSCVRTP